MSLSEIFIFCFKTTVLGFWLILFIPAIFIDAVLFI